MINNLFEKSEIIFKEHELIRKQLTTVFNSVPFGITIEDGEGKILNANNEMLKIFNLAT